MKRLRNHPRLRSLWTGMAWAVLLFTSVQVAVEMADLLFFPFVWLQRWLMLLPIPLVLGALAGGLGQVRCRAACRGRAGVLGLAGMVGFYSGVIVVMMVDSWLPIDAEAPLPLIAGAMLVAAMVELALAGLMVGAAYVGQRLAGAHENARARRQSSP